MGNVIAGVTAEGGTAEVRLVRASLDGQRDDHDRVAVEAPLEFYLHHAALGSEPVSFGTTMRTPGDDERLATGLLFGEGIIDRASDIAAIESSTRRGNIVNVRLQPNVAIHAQVPTRRYSAGSSCGVCGTTSLDEAIARAATTKIVDTRKADLAVLLRLPGLMRDRQAAFGATGGIHAAALFDYSGNLINIAEDVGRHNAFDKLVGGELLAGRVPLTDRFVILSGRASYELVQKALRAGVSILAAIGAPSSLAVNLAVASELTLVGFLRDSHCNVYAKASRLGSPARNDSI